MDKYGKGESEIGQWVIQLAGLKAAIHQPRIMFISPLHVLQGPIISSVDTEQIRGSFVRSAMVNTGPKWAIEANCSVLSLIKRKVFTTEVRRWSKLWRTECYTSRNPQSLPLGVVYPVGAQILRSTHENAPWICDDTNRTQFFHLESIMKISRTPLICFSIRM